MAKESARLVDITIPFCFLITLVDHVNTNQQFKLYLKRNQVVVGVMTSIGVGRFGLSASMNLLLNGNEVRTVC